MILEEYMSENYTNINMELQLTPNLGIQVN